MFIFFLLSFVDFRFFRKTTPVVLFYTTSVLFLILVLIVGRTIKGAKSWIDPSGLNSRIKFSVSMSCVRLPDKFWVTAFVDADLNTNYQTDFKFAPLTPMLVDLTGISRPRAKDTQSIVISQVGTVDLRTTSISVAASAQRVNLFGELVAANPINYSSLTPLVCSFPNSQQNLLLLSTRGLCTVEAFASSDATANESNRAQMSFTVNPIPMLISADATSNAIPAHWSSRSPCLIFKFLMCSIVEMACEWRDTPTPFGVPVLPEV